jgi:hypothetical protein
MDDKLSPQKTAKRAVICAQVAPETKVELERRAEEGYRSLSSEIRRALDEHLRQRPAREQAAS